MKREEFQSCMLILLVGFIIIGAAFYLSADIKSRVHEPDYCTMTAVIVGTTTDAARIKDAEGECNPADFILFKYGEPVSLLETGEKNQGRV